MTNFLRFAAIQDIQTRKLNYARFVKKILRTYVREFASSENASSYALYK